MPSLRERDFCQCTNLHGMWRTVDFGKRPNGPGDPRSSKLGYSLQEMKSEVERYFEEALLKSQLAEELPPPPEPAPAPKSVTKHKSDAVPESSFQDSTFVDIHSSKTQLRNRREEILRRIRNPQELRDLIVVNEILSKPIILRK